MKKSALTLLSLMIATAASATPVGQELFSSAAIYQGVPILDEVSMALLNGVSDDTAIEILEQVRIKRRADYGRPAHSTATFLMANGPDAMALDAWTFVQRRKEALGKARKAVIPVSDFLYKPDAQVSLVGSVSYTLYDRNKADPRNPLAIEGAPTDDLMTCTAAFHDGARYCVSLGGLKSHINNPAGFWFSTGLLDDAFGCRQIGNVRECATAMGQNVSYGDLPLYGILVELPAGRQVSRLHEQYSYVAAKATHGIVIDQRTGASLNKEPIALDQTPGAAPPWYWDTDAIKRVMQQGAAETGTARREKVAEVRAAVAAKAKEFKEQNPARVEKADDLMSNLKSWLLK